MLLALVPYWLAIIISTDIHYSGLHGSLTHHNSATISNHTIMTDRGIACIPNTLMIAVCLLNLFEINLHHKPAKWQQQFHDHFQQQRTKKST